MQLTRTEKAWLVSSPVAPGLDSLQPLASVRAKAISN
jgi:hypothetical protein